jgi:hypothetical protein
VVVSATPSMELSSRLAVAFFLHLVFDIVKIVGVLDFVIFVTVSTLVSFIDLVRLLGLQGRFDASPAFLRLRCQGDIGI